MIKRDFYLSKLKRYKDKDIIKIVTGFRRCGKSYLLFNIYYDYLLKSGVDKGHIVLVNLESKKNERLRDADALYEYVKNRIVDEKRYYVFIDEIQYVNEFEDVVNGIKTDFNTDLYIISSNSKLSSSNISTKLRGRGIEIKVYPLSFKEIYEHENRDKNEVFNDYILYGGLPFVVESDTKEAKIEYLHMFNSTTAFKDVIERQHIKNEALFDSLIKFLSSNIGSLVSPNKIANTLKTYGYQKTDNQTINNYLSYLCDAFLFYKADRFDLKGKEYLKTLSKYYAVDLGLRNEKIGFRQVEMTHILENIVYLELLRRGYIVDIGKNNEKVIDFVARSPDDIYYLQVSLSIEDSKVKEREVNVFKGLDDGYKKLVITMDSNPLLRLENGYKMINIFDFLSDDDILRKI